MNEAKSRFSLFNRVFIQVKQKCEMKYELTLSFLEELRTMDTLVDEFYYGLSFGQQRRWFDDSAALRQRLTMASNLTNVPFDERAIWRTCHLTNVPRFDDWFDRGWFGRRICDGESFNWWIDGGACFGLCIGIYYWWSEIHINTLCKLQSLSWSQYPGLQ